MLLREFGHHHWLVLQGSQDAGPLSLVVGLSAKVHEFVKSHARKTDFKAQVLLRKHAWVGFYYTLVVCLVLFLVHIVEANDVAGSEIRTIILWID